MLRDQRPGRKTGPIFWLGPVVGAGTLAKVSRSLVVEGAAAPEHSCIGTVKAGGHRLDLSEPFSSEPKCREAIRCRNGKRGPAYLSHRDGGQMQLVGDLNLARRNRVDPRHRQDPRDLDGPLSAPQPPDRTGAGAPVKTDVRRTSGDTSLATPPRQDVEVRANARTPLEFRATASGRARQIAPVRMDA